jgi:hypothetical protein
MPLVLRPWDDGKFLLVGECYVPGLMQGEAIELLVRRQINEETFYICRLL